MNEIALQPRCCICGRKLNCDNYDGRMYKLLFQYFSYNRKYFEKMAVKTQVDFLFQESAILPDRRMREVETQMQQLRLDRDNDYLKAFGLGINHTFMEIEGTRPR